MKTKEEIASEWTGKKLELFTDTAELKHIHPYITPKQCLKAMEAYHREQLSAGIKAKALRKKGTDEWYFYVGFMNDWRSENGKLLQSLDSATINPKYYPSDSELVEVTLIVEP